MSLIDHVLDPMYYEIILAAGGGGFVPDDVPQAESDALIGLYNATAGDSWSTNTNWLIDTTVNNWHGITVAGGHVTQIALNGNNLVGSVANFALDDLPSLTYLRIDTNTLSGDVSGWTLPTGLQYLYMYDTSVSGDISGWTLPNSLIYFSVGRTSVSGDLSGWSFPTGNVYFYLDSTNVEGDISGWTIAANNAYFLINNTELYGTPTLTSNVAFTYVQYSSCGLSQAQVDDFLLAVYNRRAAFTNAAPTLLIAGDNSVPSGTYQDGDPPTTGLEYVYELANDPETEGFNTWAITYTGGSAP